MMTQQTLKDYVSLITQLLECPEGQEWDLLNQYEDLVTPNLVEMMEQIAQNFRRQGDSRAANFLHYWAQEIYKKLSHAADPQTNLPHSDDYDAVIQALLDCPEGQENLVLARYKSLLDETLILRMQEWIQQLTANGQLYRAQYLQELAEQLAHQLTPHQDPASTPSNTEDRAIAAASSPPTEDPSVPLQGDLETESPNPQASQELLVPAIAKLTQVMESLTQHLQVHSVPLPYLDTLEKAQAHDWLLSTHELELLLGVKPHCSPEEKEYHRGGWRFVRVGKVGRDLLWQVIKLTPSELIVEGSEFHDTNNHDSAHAFALPTLEPDPWS